MLYLLHGRGSNLYSWPEVGVAECAAIAPFHLVLSVPPEQLPDIRLDCGMNENLFEYSRKFAERLMERKIPFTYAQAPGRHNAENWTRAVKRSMAHQYAVMMKQLGGEDT